METIIEITIIILLAIIVIFLFWDKFLQERRWRKQGDTLSKTVGERIADTTRVFGEVKEKLGELAKGTRQIEEVGKNIASLQDILRAPKFRGGFGELLLQRLLADILPHDNYELQYRFRSGEIVDAVIKIGENLVPIDSKFPLEDFERILAAESEEAEAFLKLQFNRTIKKHINNITKYILPDEHTFDFALMYIPAENVYYEIMLSGHETNKIYSYALQKRVIPVSPNSFYAYLQVIVLGLRGLHIESTASEILGHLGRLQGDLNDFQENYEILGRHIHHSANKYDEASKKLDRFSDKLKLTGDNSVERIAEETTKTDNQKNT